MRSLLIASAVIILGCGLSLGETVLSSPTARSLLTDADSAYSSREDLSKAQAALILYEKVIASDPALVEAHWKAARVAWWLGEHARNRSQKMTLFQLGVDLAKKGIELDPNSVESHFWYAGNLGSYGETRGVLKSLFLLKPIRQEMETVLRLNDQYLGGGAYRVLGVVDYKVPPIAGGNRKRARERLEKALSIDPRDPFTYYYLAEFSDVNGEEDKARSYLKSLETLDVHPDNLPEHGLVKRKAEKLQKKLAKRN